MPNHTSVYLMTNQLSSGFNRIDKQMNHQNNLQKFETY